MSVVAHRGPVTRWVEEHGLGATIAVADSNLMEVLRLNEVPSVVFVDDGRVVAVGSGVVAERFLLAHARGLQDR